MKGSADSRVETRRSNVLDEISGACGDLGTLLPYSLGAMVIAGLAPLGVLFGFGAFFLVSGLLYGMPMAVQPMKVMGIVLLTGEIDAGEVAAAGMLIGAVLLILGLTNALQFIAGLIPPAAANSLQLGLGLMMVMFGLRLLAETWWLGLLSLSLLLVFLRIPRCPAALLTIFLGAAFAYLAGMTAYPENIILGWQWPVLSLPDWSDAGRAAWLAVLPQLPMTLVNAIIITATLSHELFPRSAGRVTERRLTLSTATANLLLTPFGALPMCHGAGGVQAQYRFGARTGLAPILLGATLLLLALGFSSAAVDLLHLIPMPAVGALLVVAGADLAFSSRLYALPRSSWPALWVTAAATVVFNPAAGLVCGWGVDKAQAPAGRMWNRLKLMF